jgi:hypothetical protein
MEVGIYLSLDQTLNDLLSRSHMIIELKNLQDSFRYIEAGADQGINEATG